MSARGGLLLIHGFTGHPCSWDPVLAALPRERRQAARTLVLPGHGQPEEHAWTAGAAGFDQVVEAASSWLGPHASGLHLCGYSMGARLGLALLVRRPEAFARATLIGVHPGLSSADERAARQKADAAWQTMLEQRGLDGFLQAWEAQPLFATQVQAPAAEQARQRTLRRLHSARGLAHALRVIGLGEMPDLRPRLGALSLPVDLVAGQLDHRFAALAAELAPGLPRGRHLTLPACGHNPLVERPAELARLLADEPIEQSEHTVEATP
jgi:2-succinyl-6-hydroxy-2,4-cyclohexadiene-1-carboxylate synthase